MRKSATIKQISEKMGLTRQQTEQIFDNFVEIMSDHLANNRGYTLPKLGSFSTRIRESYQTYNPHYKGMIQLPKKKIVQFNQSSKLKNDLNNDLQ